MIGPWIWLRVVAAASNTVNVSGLKVAARFASSMLVDLELPFFTTTLV